MLLAARRYDNGQAVEIEVEGERIVGLGPTEPRDDLPWVAPGLVDLQVNGFGGHEFTSASLTAEHVRQISVALDEFGITRYCPTVTTHAFDVLHHALHTLASACEQLPVVQDRVAGFHLEGPYISGEEGPRGAHPVEHCRPPNWDEFCRLQEAAGGKIRLVTLAPEYDGSPRFIERLVSSGVVVAIGHTGAKLQQIRDAVTAGARLSTHLGNGAHGRLRRHPNYIWDQLAADQLWASLIVDGHHLPPEVVKCFVRAKTPSRCVLISDIVGLAGLPPGEYPNSGLGAVEVLDDGRLVVAGQRQYLAGASLPLLHGVTNVVRFAEVSLREAMDMASRLPAQLLGLPRVELQSGSLADLILFDLPRNHDPIGIRQTIRSGRCCYERDASAR
jgi:N-acetylglucosamine-6-phosphate deacetylase